MKKNMLIRITSSILVVGTLLIGVSMCSSTKDEPKTSQEDKKESVVNNENSNRKPQVSVGEEDNSINNETDEVVKKESNIYEDGEIIDLIDGSKLKYNYTGNHEIIEQGEGKVLIFKNITDEELLELDDSQRMLVERQIESDPLGFTVIY